MIIIRATSILNDSIREIRVTGFRNVFLISRYRIDGSAFTRWSVHDRQTMTFLFTASGIAAAIYQLEAFLQFMTQEDFDELIASLSDD
jgi:hypothetical protein